jgi:hypothetical protein
MLAIQVELEQQKEQYNALLAKYDRAERQIQLLCNEKQNFSNEANNRLTNNNAALNANVQTTHSSDFQVKNLLLKTKS